MMMASSLKDQRMRQQQQQQRLQRLSAMPLVLILMLTFGVTGSSSVAVYNVASPADTDAHCRVGYYIHDSSDFVYSATVCPPKLDCRRVRPDVPSEDIRCKMEHMGSPREFPYLEQQAYNAKHVFRFNCASVAECVEVGSDGSGKRFCYRSSRALQLAQDDPQLYVQLVQPSDAAIICA